MRIVNKEEYENLSKDALDINKLTRALAAGIDENSSIVIYESIDLRELLRGLEKDLERLGIPD